MKAALVYGIDDIRYEDTPDPGIEKDDQVKIRVKACGICRSDVPRVLNGTARYYPIILGHEFSGIVEEVGPNVTKVKPGDHVAGVPLIPCFECDDCKRGDYSLCKNYSFVGSRQQGAYADYCVIPETNVVKIPENTPWNQGALIETSTVALHGFFVCDFEKERAKNVAIIGVGTVGLFAIQWARILGAENIVAIGRDDERLSLAKELGATAVINTGSGDMEAEAKELTGGKLFNYVFDTAGAAQTILQSFKLVGNKGRICMIGTPTDEVSFTWEHWELLNRKEASVTGSWMSYSAPFPGKEWEMTTEALKNGELKYDERLIHKSFDLSNVREAFDCFKNEKVKGRILLINE